MLQTYEAVLEVDGRLRFVDPPVLPRRGRCRVLVTFTEQATDTADSGGDWAQFAGALKDSPNLSADPVEIQRTLRDEWD
jgi:hypothetical protein